MSSSTTESAYEIASSPSNNNGGTQQQQAQQQQQHKTSGVASSVSLNSSTSSSTSSAITSPTTTNEHKLRRPFANAFRKGFMGSLRTTRLERAPIEDTVKEGFIHKRGGGPSVAWKKRGFVLTSARQLFYFKIDSSGAAPSSITITSPSLSAVPLSHAKPRGCIELKSDWRVLPHKDSSREFCIQIVPHDEKERTWYLSLPNAEELNHWMHVLRDSINGQKLDKTSGKRERERERGEKCFISSALSLSE
jgi:hypothetical protein